MKKMIKMGLIKPNPHQPRKKFDEEEETFLAESIKKVGLKKPIEVTPNQDGTYTLIDGERRFRALKRNKVKSLEIGKEIIVRLVTDKELMEDGLIANCMRVDLTPPEKGKAFFNLLKSLEINDIEVACSVVNRAKDYIDNNILSEPSKRNYFIPKETVLKVADYIKMIGMSGTNIVQLLKIIELPDDIQDMVIYTPPNTKMIFERRVSKRGRKGHKVIKESSESPRRFISIAHAYELARVKDERVERFLLDKVTYDGWTTKHLRSVVDDYINSHLTGEEYFKYFRSKRRIITDLACAGLVRSIINFASTLNSYNIHQVVARASDFKKKEVIIAGMGLRNACVNLKESLDELTLTTRQLLEEKEIRMKEIKSLPFSVILTTSSKDELNPRYTIPSEIMNGLDLKFGDKLILKVVGVERLERNGKPIIEKLLE